jgi:hypothetical protein
MAKEPTRHLENYQTAEDNGGISFKPGLKVIQIPSYKYNEGELLREITEYIDKTYGEHYSQNKYQATEFIIDGGHGTGFTIGNVMKYAQRYGHKGDPADWRKDLMKVIHYAIIALHVHDLQHKGK